MFSMRKNGPFYPPSGSPAPTGPECPKCGQIKGRNEPIDGISYCNECTIALLQEKNKDKSINDIIQGISVKRRRPLGLEHPDILYTPRIGPRIDPMSPMMSDLIKGPKKQPQAKPKVEKPKMEPAKLPRKLNLYD